MTPLILTPGNATLTELEQVWREGLVVRLHDSARAGIATSAERIAAAAAGNAPVYGVNTGFGKLASVRIAPADTATLQRNLILSHCCGVGEPVEPQTVRLIMVLKLLSLGRGASGVRPELVALLEDMLAHDVLPVIPSQGSVGASGDLAPLAHMAAVMLGEGRALHKGVEMSGADALAAAGLKPLTLAAKEGLALINGTQVSTAFALVGLFDAFRAARAALVVSSMSTDAIMGSTAPFIEEIHTLRGHRGQIMSARIIRGLMEGSAIRESHQEGDSRVQDPYCIRCQPQVTGACIDVLFQAARTLEIEANAATDNPLVLTSAEGEPSLIISGGNFHAEPVALAADQIALALSEIGAIAQRRIAMMVDPAMSFGLPPFLTNDPGLNSGLMIAEVTSAALMSENKHLANPCSTDSTPTSANQEDHVSMAAHGARRLRRMNANLAHIIGIEAICAAAGIEARAPLATSGPLGAALARLRQDIAPLEQDRYLAPDLELAAVLVSSDALAKAVPAALFAELRP
ncbi:histidine ammonia-lyase [Xinfangfangia sp. CPCC 101601]|uniref:Histidine ammonia-lyase n=1 Tax=Pseudogemmobacter lacusdianii TaxID=3069608 RepID=A0ABU0VWZ0_9RHOB|nr:histidine ammonia-lyase [Xinfangfangia sp. CPCC 101601]MDQ2066028.1 histidine ammonia-lyase [Xinfangfangia sp. CPCC 101601]